MYPIRSWHGSEE